MNQSNENEEYEFILGNNGQKEYYVKVLNEPYCRSKWISKETLLNSPNGEDLISRYLHSTNHKTNPPFYNEEYDIQDHIIQKKDNLYLVKWTHLFYDHLTWEKKVDKSLITLFRIRGAAHFPSKLLSSDIIFSDESYQLTKQNIFYQDIAGLLPDVIEEIKFLLNSLQYNDVTITEIDSNYRSINSTSVFIYCLYQKLADFGPFLIVVDQREYNEWYDYLNKSKDLTTLAYNGPVQSRKTIHEIDFINDDDMTLKFHILITIPHILEEDIEHLQQIEWKFAFVHCFNDTGSNSFSNTIKTLNKLRIMRKIVFQPIDKKSIIPNAQALNTAFESNILRESAISPACENFFQFCQKSKISSTSKVESTYFYVVECPMSDIQKKVCKYILSENISLQSPEKSDFFIITRLFYYVIQHPFIIPGIESKLLQENVLFASTKMRVMRRIIFDSYIDIEESDTFPSILICTQIPEMFNIIKDFIDETYSEDMGIQAYLDTEFKPLSSSNSNLSLSSNSSNSNLYITDQISFKTIDIVIIYDGKLKHWEKLLDAKITQSTRVYKLEALDSREIEIEKTPSPTDEEICKTISLQIMIPTGNISPRDLLDENISFDMIKDDPHSSTFAVNSFVGDDFWSNFVKMPDFSLFSTILDSEKPKPNIVAKSSTEINSKKKVPQPKNKQNININDEQQQQQLNYPTTVSLYQRRQFVRSLMSFGWGNWSKIISSIGFDINDEMCKKLVLTVFSLIKYESEKNKYKKDKKAKPDKKEKKFECNNNFIANLYRDFLLQTKSDNIPIPKTSNLNPNNFKDLLRSDKYLLAVELPSDFFERILQLSCLSYFFDSTLYDESDINSFDFTYLQSTKPVIWWTDEHDRALLYGMWKYGIGNYIPFLMKEEKEKGKNDNKNDDEEEEEEEASENLYEKLLKEIIVSELNFNSLNKREIDLLSFITSYILDDLRLKNNNIQRTMPNWTDEEQELVINYVLSYGINFNSTKEINEIAAKMVNDSTEQQQIENGQVDDDDDNQNDHEKSEENSNNNKEEEDTNQAQSEDATTKNDNDDDEEESDSESEKVDIFASFQVQNQTQKSVSDFLQFIKKEIIHPSPEEGGLSLIMALKLRMRLNAMKFLHNYVQHVRKNQLYYFYAHVPKWRIGDYFISAELEHIFISKIEKKGFGKLSLILSNPTFSGITDIQILTYMKDEYRVILRINLLAQIAQKKDLFAHEPSVGENEFEKLFGISLPLSISSSYIVHSFGKICPNKPAFHNDRYLYPIGFKTSRLSPSILNAGVKARWYSEILNVNETPVFRVWQDGVPDASFEGATATAAWVMALRASKHDNNVSVSGPDSFLLTNPIVMYFLQKMPGASKCKNYKMKNLDSHPQVVQFLKSNSLLSSSNEDGSDSNAS